MRDPVGPHSDVDHATNSQVMLMELWVRRCSDEHAVRTHNMTQQWPGMVESRLSECSTRLQERTHLSNLDATCFNLMCRILATVASYLPFSPVCICRRRVCTEKYDVLSICVVHVGVCGVGVELKGNGVQWMDAPV